MRSKSVVLSSTGLNKRMLADWFSAALQTSRKCVRYIKNMRYRMSIKGRSSEVKRMHGKSLVKLGESIHTAVITGLFVAPFLVFGKQLFNGNMETVMSFFDVFFLYYDFLLILLGFMSLSGAVGVIFKNQGYDLIEEAGPER